MQINRQVGEAVRIRRRGEGNLLNSKDEFNRCKITRLSLPPAKNTITATDSNCQADCPGDKEGEGSAPEDEARGLEELLEERDRRDKEARKRHYRLENRANLNSKNMPLTSTRNKKLSAQTMEAPTRSMTHPSSKALS